MSDTDDDGDEEDKDDDTTNSTKMENGLTSKQKQRYRS